MIMKLTIEEKAELFDELEKIARYTNPDWGYHNGKWSIYFSTHSEETCPDNFREALKKYIEQKAQGLLLC